MKSAKFLGRAAFVLGIALPSLTTGCGYATGTIAAALGSSSSSGSGPNSNAVVSNLELTEEKESPARIEFLLTDTESDPTDVQILFTLPDGSPPRPVALIPDDTQDIDTELSELDTSARGVLHTFLWDFSQQVGEDTVTPNIQLQVEVAGGVSLTETTIELGNDPPLTTDLVVPAISGSGNVLIQFNVADSSSDVVRIRVEHQIEGEALWTPARPAGETTTPEFAFENVLAPAGGGAQFRFFWDTAADLFRLDRTVLVRVTAEDELRTGETLVSQPFLVDNNRNSLVLLEDILLSNASDFRRGVKIPFTVLDDDQDEVRLLFQWRRPSEDFPELPQNPPDLLALSEDPRTRAEAQLCSEFPRPILGDLYPDGSDRAKLSGLNAQTSPLLSRGLVGRSLEILRPNSIFESLSKNWKKLSLLRPAVALPIGDGRKAVIVDAPDAQTWRSQVIELATGTSGRSPITGIGFPTTAALTTDESTFYVASSRTGNWRVEQIQRDQRITASGLDASGNGPRGLAAQNSSIVYATVDDRLLRIDFSGSSPFVSEILRDLATPAGIALDPLEANLLYLAESGRDRILKVRIHDGNSEDLDSRPAMEFLPCPIRSPHSLALTQEGTRLLVTTRPPTEDPALWSLDLRSPLDLDEDGIADPPAQKIASLPRGAGNGVETGPDSLWLITDPESQNLLARGGLEQRRRVTSFDPANQIVTVDRAYEPSLARGRRYRIFDDFGPINASATGAFGEFVWDTSDVPQGGDVFLRGIPIDNDLGIASESAIALPLLSPLQGQRTELVSQGVPTVVDWDDDGDLDVLVAEGSNSQILTQTTPGVFSSSPLGLPLPDLQSRGVSISAADLDRDGDLDLITPGSTGILIFLAIQPRQFPPSPVVVPYNDPTTDRPDSVEISDVDGDGDLDLLTANGGSSVVDGSDNFSLFIQTSPGQFSLSPPLGGNKTTRNTHSILPCDVDGDGDLDLVTTNRGKGELSSSPEGPGTLAIYYQDSPGVFGPNPEIVDNDVPNIRFATAADLDADGDLDLIATHGLEQLGGRLQNSVTVYSQDEPRTFSTSPQVLGGPDSTDSAHSVTASDMDQDGDLDLVVRTQRLLTVFFQERDGEFDPVPFVLPGTGAEVSIALDGAFPPIVTDLDGDGDADVVYRDGGDENIGAVVALLQRRSEPSFNLEPQVLGDVGTNNSVHELIAADLDGDGDLDLASGNGGEFGTGPDQLSVFLQSSSRTFDAPLLLGGPDETPFPNALQAGDLDGDEDLDLVSANGFFSGTFTVFFQDAPGSFNPQPLVLDPGRAAGTWDVEVGDLDSDGDQEIVGTTTNGELLLYDQVTPGNFELTRTLNTGVVSFQGPVVTLNDIDGDGDLDVLAADAQNPGSLLTIFRQDSEGRFSSASMPTLPTSSIHVVDLDGDGHRDILLEHEHPSFPSSEGSLEIFFQNEPGSFESVSLPPRQPAGRSRQPRGTRTAQGPNSLASADVDRDGDLDLVRITGQQATLTLYTQIRPRVFVPRDLPVNIKRSSFLSLSVSDIDGDGDVDIALSNPLSASDEDSLLILWGGR